MILATATLGLLMSVIFLATAKRLAAAFVPVQVRHASLTYVRLSSVQALTSSAEAALSSSTRALDNPDVPLMISTAKFLINIVLDLLFISRFHVGSSKPTIVIQAIIRLVCEVVSVVVGLIYFGLVVVKRKRGDDGHCGRLKVSFDDLLTLVRPSLWTFAESAIRNAIYLWLINRIIQLGETYATAWGIFTTIRWGLIMVPVQALEASTLAFVGHNWGRFRADREAQYPKASRAEILSEYYKPLSWSLVNMFKGSYGLPSCHALLH
ncbi:hypothetical protein N7478_001765 [Penicillium angulare]|uniref:uncharacterized protein n=1 Tax=Penicillium angulare TaxID=116970 RepID=UPI0025412E7D|nr:uncharacterized protein N7478_001765 [Penicillium angulare]KAJ5288735.1 hypothetical protein N7478_001765 [Penicillium angulare]